MSHWRVRGNRQQVPSSFGDPLLITRVPILAGSDAGDLYSLAGFSIHEELALLVDAGFSPREALQSATKTPAEYLAPTDSLGTITEGRLADLVLLAGNPPEDIRNTRRVRAAVFDGRLYDRTDLIESSIGSWRTPRARDEAAWLALGAVGRRRLIRNSSDCAPRVNRAPWTSKSARAVTPSASLRGNGRPHNPPRESTRL
jgi:hypothetical protein